MYGSNNFPVPEPSPTCDLQSNDSSSTGDDAGMLPPDFEPSDDDVICQRGKDCFEHVGNKRFRELVNLHLNSYLMAISRKEKSKIIALIYDQIIQKAKKPSKGFVRKDLLTRRWFMVKEKEARDKVGQALRDANKILRANSKKASGAAKNASSSPAANLTGRKRSMGAMDQTTDQGSSSELRSNSPSTMISRPIEAQNPQLGSLHFNVDGCVGINIHYLPMPPNMLSSVIEPLNDSKSFKKLRKPGSQSDNSNSKSSSGMSLKGTQQHSSICWKDFMSCSKVSPHLSMLSENRDVLDDGRRSMGEHQPTHLLRHHTPGLAASSTAPSPEVLPVLMQQQVNDITAEQANGFIQSLTGIQGFWDLEPTPLMGIRRKGSEEK